MRIAERRFAHEVGPHVHGIQNLVEALSPDDGPAAESPAFPFALSPHFCGQSLNLHIALRVVFHARRPLGRRPQYGRAGADQLPDLS